MTRLRVDLVIFDNDGVLVDSEPIACQVLADLLTRSGLPTTFDDVVSNYLGGSLKRTRGLAEQRLGEKLDATFERDFHRELFDRYPFELSPVQGIKEAVHGLSAAEGLATCVASSGTHERIRQSLSVVGLIEFFDGRIHGAVDDYRSFSKQMVIERILDENNVDGARLIGFGDGYVEIDNVKSSGGVAVAVASDESKRSGKADTWKRERLIGVGADVVIPDFREFDALCGFLWKDRCCRSSSLIAAACRFCRLANAHTISISRRC